MRRDLSTARPEVLLRHAGWLRALAHSLIADATLADDIVQVARGRVLERPPRAGKSVRVWLEMVLRSRALRRLRTDARHGGRERQMPTTDDLVSRLKQDQILIACLLALPEPYRSTITLRYHEGLSAVEIASKRGIPAAAVRSHLKRGLDELRTHLDRRHDGRREAWCTAFLLAFRPG